MRTRKTKRIGRPRVAVFALGICAAFLAPRSFGQPLPGQIEVDPIQQRDRPVVIKHAAGQTVTAMFCNPGAGTWQTLPDSHFVRSETQTVLVAPPGEYVLTLGGSAIIRVLESNPPPPGPGPKPPGPGPAPKPKPPAGINARWLLFIDEVSERENRPDQTAVIFSETLRAEMADRGLTVRILDKDQAAAGPFLRLAGDHMPAMILLTDDGDDDGTDEQARAFAVPATVDEVETIIRGNVIR